MRKQSILPLALAAMLTACAGTGAEYEPIVDGPKNEAYELDLTACQKLAEERSYTNPDVKTEAAAGAVVGGIHGALENRETAIAGAVVGAVFGGGGKAFDAIEERKGIVKKCMQGRGYEVLG